MKIHNEVQINAPAEAAWEVLGLGFGDVCEWSPGMSESDLIGTLDVGGHRRCVSTGWGPFPAGTVTEELIQFDSDAMKFAYIARSGTPWFIDHGENAWSIEANGPGRCVVRFDATMKLVWWLRLLGPVMVRLMHGAMTDMNEEMKYRIEEGRPHPWVTAARQHSS